MSKISSILTFWPAHLFRLNFRSNHLFVEKPEEDFAAEVEKMKAGK